MYDRLVSVTRTRSYFLETVIGIVVIAAVNLAVAPRDPAFTSVNPNPYWIVVIAIAARYGRNGALFAGILTAVMFIAHHVLLGGFDAIYDDMWLLRFPFFFVLVGFMIGEVKTVFILREDYLTKRIEELENLNNRLKNENDIVKEAHRNLSVEVVTKQDTITILNEITGKFKSYEPSAIYAGVLESFRDTLGAEECSFYASEGGELKLKHSLGWKDYQRRPATYEFGRGLVGIAAQALHTVNIKDFVLRRMAPQSVEPDMLGDSVLAVPLVGIENKVFGVASIDKIPLLKLTDATIQTARIIGELAASALNNAYAFREVEAAQIKEARYGVFKYHYFVERLDEECRRGQSYLLPVAVMALKWPKLGLLTAAPAEPLNECSPRQAAGHHRNCPSPLVGEGRERGHSFSPSPRLPRQGGGEAATPRQAAGDYLVETVTTLVQTKLRAFDVLALGPAPDVPLLALLSTTTAAQAEGIKRMIIDQLRAYGLAQALVDGPIEDSIVLVDFKPPAIAVPQDFLRAVGVVPVAS